MLVGLLYFESKSNDDFRNNHVMHATEALIDNTAALASFAAEIEFGHDIQIEQIAVQRKTNDVLKELKTVIQYQK